MQAGTMERRTVSIPEAAAILGIGRGSAYRLAASGQLPVLRLGGRIVVSRDGLDEMLRITADRYLSKTPAE
jgi:excisionase family DNA binding protein